MAKNLQQVLQELQQMNHLSNISKEICFQEITSLKKELQETLNKQTLHQIKQKLSLMLITKKNLFKSLKRIKPNQKASKLLKELYFIIAIGIYVCFGKKIPKQTQLLCFWLNTRCQRLIEEVKTGEGKTMIVAMTALFYALIGKKVDVFTSSATLATTETRPGCEVYELFKLFKVSLSSNCQLKKTANPRKVYSCQVIYGTSCQFEADFLRYRFAGESQYFIDRNFDENHIAILDEVDALLIDRMSSSCRLFGQKPLYQTIRIVFILINQVRQKLRAAKLQWSGQMTIHILGNQINLNGLQFDLQEQQKLKNKKEYINAQEQLIHKIVLNGLTCSGIKHIIPKYMINNYGYIRYMLPIWIKNLSYSIYLKKDVHYYVQGEHVVPVDISTGNFQNQCKWENGIHQFIEIRQKLQPSVEGIVSNYQSNYIYFTRYQSNFYGMTGTITPSIGKTLQQIKNQKSIIENFLKEAYKVDILKIPTAKKRLLIQKNPIISLKIKDWYQSILKQTLEQSNKRMVLIIFQTISETKHFLEMLREQKRLNLIHQMYNSNEYHKNLNSIKDDVGTVIVATNLGGRGTDIKIQNKTIIQNGGLHVIMTYFPDSTRIEQQAFGRAGRNGQPGSGRFNISLHDKFIIDNQTYQMYKKNLNQQNNAKIILQELKANRIHIEERNFQFGKKTIRFERQKSILLNKYYQQYIMPLNKSIKNSKSNYQSLPSLNHRINYYQNKIKKQNVQEQFGLFLKRKLYQKEQNGQMQVKFDDFVTYYDNACCRNQLNPGYYSNYGSLLIGVNTQKAKQYFNKYVQQDDWIHQYYKMYFYLKENEGELDKSKVQTINTKIKKLVISMIAAYSLKQAIIPANSTQSQQKSKNLGKFFIDEIGDFKAITQILQQCLKMKGRRLTYMVYIQTKQHKIDQLLIRGMRHHIRLQLFQIIQQQKKQKEGFFSSLFNGIKSLAKAIVRTVFNTAVTLLSVMVTPIVAIFGQKKEVEKLWNEVDQQWKENCQQWDQVLKHKYPLATVAFAFLAITKDLKFASNASQCFNCWLKEQGETVKTYRYQKKELSKNNGNPNCNQLVRITGKYKLDKKIQETLQKQRQQLQTQQIKINNKYEILQTKLKRYLHDPYIKQQIDQIIFLGASAKQVSHQNYILNKRQIQKAEQIQQRQIKFKYGSQLKSNFANLQSKTQSLITKKMTIINQEKNSMEKKLQQVLQQELFNAKQNKLNQEQFDVIQKQEIMQAQKKFHLFQSRHKHQVLTATQDLSNDSKNLPKFMQNIVSVDPNFVKDKQNRRIIEDSQNQYLQRLSKKFKKMHNHQLNKLSTQSNQMVQVQLQNIDASYIEQIKIQITSIFQKPSNINQLFHYAKIAEYYAKINKLTFKKADDHLQAVEAVKQLCEPCLIISNDGFIIKNDQNKILTKSWIRNAQIQEIFLSMENCDIQYWSQELPKQKGIQIISKLFNYFKKGNNETKLNWDKISDLYIKSVIYQQIQALLKGKFAQIYERRLLKKINLNYLPFEIEENEEQFEQFKNNLMDIIIKKHLIQSEIILKYRYKIKSVLQNLQTQQYKQWMKISQK